LRSAGFPTTQALFGQSALSTGRKLHRGQKSKRRAAARERRKQVLEARLLALDSLTGGFEPLGELVDVCGRPDDAEPKLVLAPFHPDVSRAVEHQPAPLLELPPGASELELRLRDDRR
jgi:hypothetical protein